MTGQSVSFVELVAGTAVVVAAAAAVLAPRRLVSVVSFLVFGVLLSVLWALMGAPDVALAEAAIGTGVTGALFVTVVTRSSGEAHGVEPAPRRQTVASLIAVAVMTGGLGAALVASAEQGAGRQQGLGDRVADDLAATGVEHPVTGVLLGFRSYDTLMEVIALVTAVLVVLAVPRPQAGRGTAAGAPPAPLTWFVRILAPVLGLLSAWLLVAGSSRPGGAFQAGAVLAATLILAHVTDTLRLRPPSPATRAAVFTGAAAFLILAFVGVLTNGAWLATHATWAGPVTVLLESVLTVTIGVALALVYVSLVDGDPA